MTTTRRSLMVTALLAFAVIIVLAIISGQKAHAATMSPGTHTTASQHAPKHALKWYALKWAESQAGKPYVYGGSGPSYYDCSGLVMAAWAHEGKALPHNTAAMLASGKLYPIPASRRQPGDLVFWGDFHVEFATQHGTFGAHSPGTLVGWVRFWGYPTFWRVR